MEYDLMHDIHVPYASQIIFRQTTGPKDLKRCRPADEPRVLRIPRSEDVIVVFLLGFAQRP